MIRIQTAQDISNAFVGAIVRKAMPAEGIPENETRGLGPGVLVRRVAGVTQIRDEQTTPVLVLFRFDADAVMLKEAIDARSRSLGLSLHRKRGSKESADRIG
jgi:hypothetical protein